MGWWYGSSSRASPEFKLQSHLKERERERERKRERERERSSKYRPAQDRKGLP
jgi:hypothetical protein